MSRFKEHTATELLKLANDAKEMHDNLKQEIIRETEVIDELTNNVNEKIEVLNFIEKNYVEIIEELNKRDAV